MHHITERLVVVADMPNRQVIARAAALLRAGGLVAFPTETVYGLGTNALDARAVGRVFQAKERPTNDPLIVHLASVDDLPIVVADLLPTVERLSQAFWPGPLTLVLPRAAAVPPAVSAGRDTVAVRVPSHPIAQALIAAAATPIAAPSANRFGHTSPTTADHVLDDLNGRIDLVIDGGPTPIGIESTVLDLTSPVPMVLRPGAVSREALASVLGAVVLPERSRQPQTSYKSPGMVERHYAPLAELWLCVGQPPAALTWVSQQASQLQTSGQRVGLLLCDEDIERLQVKGLLSRQANEHDTLLVERLGSESQLEQIANRLYAALRSLDDRLPAVILTRDFGTAELALALRDRLTRAANGRVVTVGDEPI